MSETVAAEAATRPATDSQDLRRRFGRNLRTVRKLAGLTQAEVSERCGILQKDVSAIELGKVNITIGQMHRIADALNHSVEHLLKAGPYTPNQE